MINPQDIPLIDDIAAGSMAEDLGRGDITSRAVVKPGQQARGNFTAKQELVLAGLEVADAVFMHLDPYLEVETTAADGELLQADKVFARVVGDAQMLLAAERVALNFLQHLSGIATLTRKYVEAIAGTKARIVDTRKTAPGLRALQKYAVLVGGGHNHRMGLDDGVLIKENHIALVGSVTTAVARAKEAAGHLHKIEVEVATLDQVTEALKAKADILLLDNMTPEMIRQAVELVEAHEPGERRTLLETSGDITLANVRAYAEAGVDLISIAALTHSAPAVDISFKIKPV